MGTCKRCGLPIVFKIVGKKLHPLNPDGTEHYDVCNQAKTKKVIDEGKPFADKSGSGFIHKGKKIYHTKTSGFIVGENYREENDRT